MEDKTLVSNPNDMSASFSMPPIHKPAIPPVGISVPKAPTIPPISGVKNVAVQRAGIAAAAGLALIGATAYAIIVNDDKVDEASVQNSAVSSEPIINEPIIQSNVVASVPPALPIEPILTPSNASVMLPKLPPTAHQVVNATIFPEAPISISVNNDMSFNQAFVAARTEVGAGGVFVWRGKSYDTYYTEEWEAMSPDQQAQYNQSVHVTIPEEVHELADTQSEAPPLSNFTTGLPELSSQNKEIHSEHNESAILVEKPQPNIESSLITAKGINATDNLFIDKPDVDIGNIPIMPVLPNDGAVANVLKEVNLPEDMLTRQADNNADGITDAILIEDKTGHIQAILIDENQNGIYEQAVLDTNNNFKPDLYIVDANEDGAIDQEKMLQDNSADFNNILHLHDNALTLNEENNMMMNDIADFDSHIDITDTL